MYILIFFSILFKSDRIKLLWLFLYTVIKLFKIIKLLFFIYTLLQIKIRHTKGAIGVRQPPERGGGPQKVGNHWYRLHSF